MEEQLKEHLAQKLAQGQQLAAQREQLLTQANRIMEEMLRLGGEVRYIQHLQAILSKEQEATTE